MDVVELYELLPYRLAAKKNSSCVLELETDV